MIQQTINPVIIKGEDKLAWILLRLLILIIIILSILLEIGFYEPVIGVSYLIGMQLLGLAGLWFTYGINYYRQANVSTWLRSRLPALITLSAATILFFIDHLYTVWLIIILIVIIFTRIYAALAHKNIRPGLLFISSFILLIVIGSVLLLLPRATPVDDPISLLDALFTATSAVCVTGLIVRDTATEFTGFGQTIILILIQLGGLSIVIFGALFAALLSGSLSLKQTVSISDLLQSTQGGLSNIQRMLRFVVVATFVVEGIGALILYFDYPYQAPDPLATHRISYSIFISISAFCNAGFAPYSNSLMDMRSSFSVHGVVLPLIVIGGLGFPVLLNFWEIAAARVRVLLLKYDLLKTSRKFTQVKLIRLTLHSKLVITTTAILYLFGLVGITFGQLIPHLQWSIPQEGASISAQELRPVVDFQMIGLHVLDASFMSVSTRTAGFSTIDMAQSSSTSNGIMMLQMLVGGSPGSTAGGIKTIALSILLLTLWATLRGRKETEVFRRTIPEVMVRKSGVIVLLGFLLVAIITIGLTISESSRLEVAMFEAVSACSTVGLSLNFTDSLSSVGRIIIVIAMFTGRVGPLAILGVITFGKYDNARYHYPTERVVMG